MAAIDEDKMRENQLMWFEHIKERSTYVSVIKCDYETETQSKKGRGRLWIEVLGKGMEYLELMEDLVQDQEQWRSRMHITNPLGGIELCCCYCCTHKCKYIICATAGVIFF